jgi:hypothetical protein
VTQGKFAGYMPMSLPLSCLTMAPRLDCFNQPEYNNRTPLGEMNLNGFSEQDVIACRAPNSPRKLKPIAEITETQRACHDIKKMLYTLREQLAVVLKAKPARDLTSSTGRERSSFLYLCNISMSI